MTSEYQLLNWIKQSMNDFFIYHTKRSLHSVVSHSEGIRVDFVCIRLEGQRLYWPSPYTNQASAHFWEPVLLAALESSKLSGWIIWFNWNRFNYFSNVESLRTNFHNGQARHWVFVEHTVNDWRGTSPSGQQTAMQIYHATESNVIEIKIVSIHSTRQLVDQLTVEMRWLHPRESCGRMRLRCRHHNCAPWPHQLLLAICSMSID